MKLHHFSLATPFAQESTFIDANFQIRQSEHLINNYKGSVLKTVPKATFSMCSSAQSLREIRDIIGFLCHPGQMQKFRDCPGHSETLGNYEHCFGKRRNYSFLGLCA